MYSYYFFGNCPIRSWRLKKRMAARSYRYEAGQDCEFSSKEATMKAEYQIVDHKDSRALAAFLSREGQLLLPMLELIEQAEMAVDELIDVAGRATIEAVLTLSARAFPVSVFRAAGFSPRGFSQFDVLRSAVDPEYENENCFKELAGPKHPGKVGDVVGRYPPQR